jgi:hypothetical protein
VVGVWWWWVVVWGELADFEEVESRASISARTPYRADWSSRPVRRVSGPWRWEAMAGNADRAVGPRWPWIRIWYRVGAGSMA